MTKPSRWRWRASIVGTLMIAVCGGGTLIAFAQPNTDSASTSQVDTRCELSDGASFPKEEPQAPERVATEKQPDGSVESTEFYDGSDSFVVNSCNADGELENSQTVQTFDTDDGEVRLVTGERTVHPDGTISQVFSTYDPASKQFDQALDSPEGDKQLEAVPEPTGQETATQQTP